MLLAAAIAVPLLALQQYRWLSDLAAAQRTEAHVAWADAVERSAAAINDDLSTFYAAMLDAGGHPLDIDSIGLAVSTWKDAASTLGSLARIYAHDSRREQWFAIPGSGAIGDVESIAALGSSGLRAPFSATWVAAEGSRTLPALTVTLDPTRSDIDAVLLTFGADACDRMLHTLAESHFAARPQVRLAVIDDRPSTRPSCADPKFDQPQIDDTRAPVFRLGPPRHVARPTDDSQPRIGVVMSRDLESHSWHLHARDGGDSTVSGARALQRLNLWTAAALELTVVGALVAVAIAAGRARRTASTHVRVSAVVAHELRTPLAAIKVLAQNQQRGLIRSQQQVEQYGATIAGEADRLHQFVERALQFTEGRAANRSPTTGPVDFEHVLAEAVRPLEGRAAAAGVSIQSNVEPDVRLASGDESALVLAVRNLVHNALDHATAARTIRITVQRHKRHAIVSVADDGAGVPQSERATLFEPFVRGSGARQQRGHGIGLAIVRDVARAHGGRAWYDGARAGSLFAFTVLLRTTRSL